MLKEVPGPLTASAALSWSRGVGVLPGHMWFRDGSPRQARWPCGEGGPHPLNTAKAAWWFDASFCLTRPPPPNSNHHYSLLGPRREGPAVWADGKPVAGMQGQGPQSPGPGALLSRSTLTFGGSTGRKKAAASLRRLNPSLGFKPQNHEGSCGCLRRAGRLLGTGHHHSAHMDCTGSWCQGVDSSPPPTQKDTRSPTWGWGRNVSQGPHQPHGAGGRPSLAGPALSSPRLCSSAGKPRPGVPGPCAEGGSARHRADPIWVWVLFHSQRL